MIQRMQNRKRPLPGESALFAEACRLFRYEQETGELIWIGFTDPKNPGKIKLGTSVTGEDGHGYKSCRLFGQRVKVHQVVWLMCNGYWPTMPIDHADTDRRNNRIKNLRLATDQQNVWNMPVKNGRFVSGVSRITGRPGWAARIQCGGKKQYLGYFPTRELAEAAYHAACLDQRGEFAARSK